MESDSVHKFPLAAWIVIIVIILITEVCACICFGMERNKNNNNNKQKNVEPFSEYCFLLTIKSNQCGQ